IRARPPPPPPPPPTAPPPASPPPSPPPPPTAPPSPGPPHPPPRPKPGPKPRRNPRPGVSRCRPTRSSINASGWLARRTVVILPVLARLLPIILCWARLFILPAVICCLLVSSACTAILGLATILSPVPLCCLLLPLSTLRCIPRLTPLLRILPSSPCTPRSSFLSTALSSCKLLSPIPLARISLPP